MGSAQVQSAPKPDSLNDRFTPLSPYHRLVQLYQLFSPEEVLVTSSFGTSSALLLYLISQVQPRQTVYFIDTTFLFPETLEYKRYLADLYRLNVVDILPLPSENAQSKEEQWWINDPDRCCLANKVLPLEAVKPGHRVWISGLMGFQNTNRSHLHVLEESRGISKFHPLIDVTSERFRLYGDIYDLPPHPLEQMGYGSVGCVQCTRKGEGRTGRWAGMEKTECGLHLPYPK